MSYCAAARTAAPGHELPPEYGSSGAPAIQVFLLDLISSTLARPNSIRLLWQPKTSGFQGFGYPVASLAGGGDTRRAIAVYYQGPGDIIEPAPGAAAEAT